MHRVHAMIFLEAANNVSHWLELQEPALAGVLLKVPVVGEAESGMDRRSCEHGRSRGLPLGPRFARARELLEDHLRE